MASPVSTSTPAAVWMVTVTPATLSTTLESALKKLPKDQFVQIHRSYAVPLGLITEIASDVLVLSSTLSITLPVSKQHYPELLKKLEIFGMDKPVKRKTRRILRNMIED